MLAPAAGAAARLFMRARMGEFFIRVLIRCRSEDPALAGKPGVCWLGAAGVVAVGAAATGASTADDVELMLEVECALPRRSGVLGSAHRNRSDRKLDWPP